MTTQTCELCGKDYITEVCNGCAFDSMFKESKQAQADMEEAGRRLVEKVEAINKILRANKVQELIKEAIENDRKASESMTEEQLIERERVSTDVTSSESTIL